MFGRLSNPLLPRIEYVSKQYGDYVTMATFSAWTEATGQHRLGEDAARVFYDANEDARVTIAQLPRLMSELGAPRDTRFDRYLPWAAREFNRIFKPYGKLAKREGLPLFPPGYDIPTATMRHAPPELDQYVAWTVDLTRDTRALRNRFRSIVDWAEAERIDLARYTWKQALADSESWSEQRTAEKMPQGVVVYRFDDGWTVQQLSRQAQLDAEGDVMQHCVEDYVAGDPVRSYDGRDVWIYSLRDSKGAPHATMEWDLADSYVSQLRGKQNDIPNREYLERMLGFRREYLDPILAEMGFSDVEDPEGYDLFGRTPLLGTYNVSGAYDARPDSTLLVYAEPARGNAAVFSPEAVADGLRRLEDRFDEWWADAWESPPDLPEDELDEWLDAARQEAWMKGLSSADVTKVAEAGSPYHSLHWLVWRDHQAVLEDNEDEMVQWLAGGAWSPTCRFLGQRAANKAALLALPRRGILRR